MSKAQVQMAYEGSALNDHNMDVRQLAPALLAVGNLCREANRIVNGERAEVSVLVTSDFEHKCFLINFDIHQSVMDQVRTLLQSADVKSAKELLELIGLLTGPPLLSLFAYLKRRRGKDVTVIEDHRRDGTVTLQIEGDNNQVTISNQVFQMSQEPSILDACKGVVAPTQAHGIESVSFRERDQTQERISKEEAREILATAPRPAPPDPTDEEPQVVTALLRIHSVVFDKQSRAKWPFWYGKTKINVDVSQTDIPRRYVERGMASMDDRWRVKLQIKQRRNSQGEDVNEYKILDVVDFIPGARQQTLPLGP